MKITHTLNNNVPFEQVKEGQVFTTKEPSKLLTAMKIQTIYGKLNNNTNAIDLTDGTALYVKDDTIVHTVNCELRINDDMMP